MGGYIEGGHMREVVIGCGCVTGPGMSVHRIILAKGGRYIGQTHGHSCL